mgnify:CR=1 FL=1
MLTTRLTNSIWAVIVAILVGGLLFWYLKRSSSEDTAYSTIRKTVIVGGFLVLTAAILWFLYKRAVYLCEAQGGVASTWVIIPLVVLGIAVSGIFYIYKKVPDQILDSTSKLIITIMLCLLALVSLPIGKQLMQSVCIFKRPISFTQRYHPETGLTDL